MPARAIATRIAPRRPAPPLLPGLAPVSGKSVTSAVAVAVRSTRVGDVAGVSFSPPVSSVVGVADGVSVGGTGVAVAS
jgi:hypothetical protein